MAKIKNKKIKKAPPKRSAAPVDVEANDDDTEILEAARKGLKECVDGEETEREKMMDDLRFATLDQWPDDIRKERENDTENGARPCLTIDKINQYIVQILNDIRQGKPGINVRPQDDVADPETAKVLKGLVRNIEDQSKADIAYLAAVESAVKIGLGYFRITTEYVSDDSFDQEIFIRPIPNTFSTYLSRHSMPDGSDAELGYIVEAMPVEKFKAEHPKAKWKVGEFEGLADVQGYWRTDDSVTVIEEYRIKRTAETLCFLADGTTISRKDYDAWPKEAGAKPTIQDERTTIKRQLQWRKMTGIEVLDKRDLPGKYIPIVEVIGRESQIKGERILWGIVRPAKDSLRMYNYFASALTEKMALAPKAPWVGAVGQFATKGDNWKKSNRVNFPVLEYDATDVNGTAIPAPQRQGATPMETALVHHMQTIEHDVQTSLGMFKAATGESESQQSGRAILALQKESDTGTYHFGANLGLSIRHAGVIIVDLIPHYYDTKRIVRIMGDDGEIQTAMLDPDQEQSHRQIQTSEGIKSIYNPGVGKFDVSITTGPSYNTKRMEAAATYVEMAKGASDPASASILRYLVMRNSDFSGADEGAKLLRTVLPPAALQALESKAPIPPQAQAQMQQMRAQMQQMQEAGQKLHQENQQLKAGTQADMAKISAHQQESQAKLQVHIQEKQAELQFREMEARATMALERERAANAIALEREKAAAELELEAMKERAEQETELRKAALQAATAIEVARINATKDAAEGVAPTAGDQAGEIMRQILETQNRLLAAHSAPKKISMVMPDGGEASAHVTVQ